MPLYWLAFLREFTDAAVENEADVVAQISFISYEHSQTLRLTENLGPTYTPKHTLLQTPHTAQITT